MQEEAVGTMAVALLGLLVKRRDSASNNRTGSCMFGLGSVDYESLAIRKNGEIRRLDKRTSIRWLSVCVVDREPLAQIRAIFHAELDKRPPVV